MCVCVRARDMIQSAKALAECSIDNDNNQRLSAESGAIPALVKLLRSADLAVQTQR